MPKSNGDSIILRTAALVMLLSVALSSVANEASDTDGGFTNDPYLQSFEENSIPIVLTTSRLRQPQSEVPASVTIIDREMIEMIGARELPELMRLVPGMSIGNVDGNIPTVSYHATVSRDVKRMQVMIDGRSVYQPGLARVLWDDIPITVDDIERIEITRGPNAAAYGPNSFSAIINILTRHPQDTQWAKGRLAGGNNGIADVFARGGAALNRASFRVSAYGRSDDGYDFNEEDIERNDKKELTGFNSRAVFQVNNRHSAEMHLGYSETDREIDSLDGWTAFGTFEETPEMSNENYFGMLKWQSDFNDWHTLKLQAYSQKSRQNGDWETCMNSALFSSQTNLLVTREAYELREFYRTQFELAGNKKPDKASYEGAGEFSIVAEQLVEVVAAALGSNPDPDELLLNVQAQAETYIGRSLLPAEDALLVRARDIAIASSGTVPLLCGTVDNKLDEKRTDIEIVDNLVLGKMFRFVLGAAYREEEGDSLYYLNGQKQTNKGSRVFAHMEFRPWKWWVINIGQHYEDDDISGAETSPRYAMSFMWYNQSIRLVYSEATRSVDIYEDAAEPRIYIKSLNSAYATDTANLLGQSNAIFFMRESVDVEMKSEKIESSEIGYYGLYSNQLEIDIRVFEEKLTDLFSDSLNLADFDPNNRSYVTLKGAEAQLKWYITRNDLFMLQYANIDNEASTKTETRFTAEDSGSIMYNHRFNFGLNLNLAYHVADRYNILADNGGLKFERVDLGIAQDIRISNTVLTVAGKIMYRIDDNAFVSEDNNYNDREIYYLTAAVQF